MKEEIKKKIEEILKELGVNEPRINFDTPTHYNLGDYTSNVALLHAKEVSKKPLDLANEISESLKGISGIKKIEVAPPGFINFFFDEKYFADAVNKPLERGKLFNGERTIVEYTDPNPFKEFHIGHLMPNVIGESISRIIEENGSEVKRANYQGDVGLHVAKAVWALKKGVDLKNAYAEGHKAYEEDENAKSEIIGINKKIYDKSDAEINDIYEENRQKSLLYFEVIYQMLGTKFDYYFFESEVADFGKETVVNNTGKIFVQSDGAVVFKGEEYDKKLHTRVFINKEGIPTYEAKELGLAKIKLEKYDYTKSIVVTGNEINEYFKVLLKAMSLVFPELAEKTVHISHGMLRLPEGKMSSRTGNVITAESLISQVQEKVKEKIDDLEISHQIAIGAIKYSILRQAIGGDIIFDFDKSISFEGDSGPYLQYSTVRAKSLLSKADGIVEISSELPDGWVTTDLERMLERYPEVLEKAGKDFSPNYIATYLTQLSSEFNSFYAEGKIIGEKDINSGYKLKIVEKFVDIMTKGLYLLGIKAPSHM